MVVERLLLDVHIEQAAPMEVVVRLPEGPGGNDAIDTKFLAFSNGQGSQDGEKAHHHAGDSKRDKEQGGVSDPRGDRRFLNDESRHGDRAEERRVGKAWVAKCSNR